MVSATPRARRSTAGKSTRTSGISTPYSEARLAWKATLAEAMAALVGLHPKFTHEPPRSLRSASATVKSRLASL